MNKIPCIALVGNAATDKHELLNATLSEEGLDELYDVILYSADGQPNAEALQDAIDDYRNGSIDGIACLPMPLPVQKIADMAAGKDDTPVAPITIHSTARLASVMATEDAGEASTCMRQNHIVEKATMLARCMKRDLRILNPRIAILSLNKEISLSETSEEINVMAPAVSELVKAGIQAFGPIASGTFFDGDGYKSFDAVMEAYSGQCMENFLTVSNDAPVTLLAGIDIPIVQAEPETILKAIYLAADIQRNRIRYDEPLKNPLPKLYHEKKEDGEKARFAIRKKGFNPEEHRREHLPAPAAAPTTKTEGETVKEK